MKKIVNAALAALLALSACGGESTKVAPVATTGIIDPHQECSDKLLSLVKQFTEAGMMPRRLGGMTDLDRAMGDLWWNILAAAGYYSGPVEPYYGVFAEVVASRCFNTDVQQLVKDWTSG